MCDYIIFQPIKPETSPNFNYDKIKSYCNEKCLQITFIGVYVEGDFDKAIAEIKRRESEWNVLIKTSDILSKYRNEKLFLTINHPTTFFFLKFVEEVCVHLNVEYFKNTDKYLVTNNYTELPL